MSSSSSGRSSRIAVVTEDRCRPSKCGQQCRKRCPVNATGIIHVCLFFCACAAPRLFQSGLVHDLCPGVLCRGAAIGLAALGFWVAERESRLVPLYGLHLVSVQSILAQLREIVLRMRITCGLLRNQDELFACKIEIAIVVVLAFYVKNKPKCYLTACPFTTTENT